ncbi:serine/arginine repetitive matrix protein 1-like isoform X2 [Leptopilina boulardi]|uniref:serine/arginine repetitive matrix protein 1-like isoform X2 n=1 Tax=Leptopilina boulardi TaxID=63433 RepID=UPI0021F645CB|nr:serine/arginine repetitive matrix protein 1-like isoform X2 [Leptopilina boulardi]
MCYNYKPVYIFVKIVCAVKCQDNSCISKNTVLINKNNVSHILSKHIMDYHKKIVSAQSHKCKNEDDEDDLEALRLAALQTLRVKDTLQKKRNSPHRSHVGGFQGSQSLRYYKQSRGDHFHHRQQRQNGVRHNYFPKNIYRNPNLIEIVPQGEVNPTSVSKENIDKKVNQTPSDGSKFQRYDDNASGSEDDEVKDVDVKVEVKTEETESAEADESAADRESESGIKENSSEKAAEEADEDRLLNDDDDDVLLMADLEEEDSLERLMDEMEREIKDDKIDITEKKVIKKEKIALKKVRDPSKLKGEVTNVKEDSLKDKVEISVPPKPVTIVAKAEPRPLSPRTNIRKRSPSPKSRPWRKVSPRRSPRRSPLRLLKKPLREISRYRSPRKSPTRYSPRSPKISPRQKSPRLSPQRSPDRRSPLMSRALSPRNRSPRPTRSLSRSPRMWSRSPRSRSRTPRRSPRRLRSPRYSPHRYSPRPKIRASRSRSPRSPRRRISRSRSPPRSPRRASSRLRSPRMSPRRLSPPRYRSPRGSPRRSPWSSPRRSPRMSPKRLKSPRWSPKECTRKPRITKSVTPEKRSNSPQKKNQLIDEKKSSSEMEKSKSKKENLPQKSQVIETVKEEPILDPVLEARKRKFESVTPIDPINANKTIKLSNKKEETKKTIIKPPEVKEVEVKKIVVKRTEQPTEVMEESVERRRRKVITVESKDEEVDLLPDEIYDSESVEEEINEEAIEKIPEAEEISLEVHPLNQEKKKKKDKEIYQVGKLKDLAMSDRIAKEKKFKKRKMETTVGGTSEIETELEDVTSIDEEGDLRTELSRRRAERLNRAVPIQSARLLQSAFKGVVNEVAKNNAKVNQRFALKGTEKAQKEVRRVTVLHRTISDFQDSEEEAPLEAKVPVRLRLGVNKVLQETRETKISRKASKKQGRKVKHKNSLPLDSKNSL